MPPRPLSPPGSVVGRPRLRFRGLPRVGLWLTLVATTYNLVRMSTIERKQAHQQAAA